MTPDTHYPVSARELVRFTPPAAELSTPRPIYLIAPATLIERQLCRRDLALLGVRYPTDAEMYACLRDAVDSVVEPADRPRALELIDQHEALPDERPALARRMDHLEGEIRRAWPPYAALMADREFWAAMAPIAAARRFLRGWEGLDLPFRQGADGLVPEAILDSLPPGHVTAIGWRAMQLMNPSEADRKNSVAPSPSGGGRGTSSATARPTVARAGSSAASSTKRTRATVSRPTSGRS